MSVYVATDIKSRLFFRGLNKTGKRAYIVKHKAGSG